MAYDRVKTARHNIRFVKLWWRVCKIANKVFENTAECKITMHLYHARPDEPAGKLAAFIKKHNLQDWVSVRATNYAYGLLSKIFDPTVFHELDLTKEFAIVRKASRKAS